MTLIDKDIKNWAEKIITSGYDEKRVNPASYDVTIGEIIGETENLDEKVLHPDEMIFIKTNEEIHMPDNLLGVIGEKNSLMRAGIWVSGPRYFPGHKTYMFLRVKNISQKDFKLKSGMAIAQIFFEQLTGNSEVPYNKQENASFNDETEYRGLGKYETEYNNQIAHYEKAKKNLEDVQGKMYTNIITIMGLFVSIFSLIMVNLSNYGSQPLDKHMILTVNLSLGFVISLFMGLIFLLFNHATSRKWVFGIILILMIAFLAVLILV